MKQTKKPGAAQAPPQTAYDWSQHDATGFERTSVDDLGIPFLVIIQKGSPEVDKTHKDYQTKRIAGIEVGSIINTVTRQVLYTPPGDDEDPTPLLFVPCFYEKLFAEWKPRDSGGGFVKHHGNPAILNECKRSDEDNRDYLPNGNVIVTTAYFYGQALVVNDEGELEGQTCVLPMSSTQLKKARLWLNLMMSIRVDSPAGKVRPPMFSHRFAITTNAEQNAEGSWYGWHVELEGMVKEPKLIEASVDIAKRMSSPNRLQIGAPAQAGNVPF